MGTKTTAVKEAAEEKENESTGAKNENTGARLTKSSKAVKISAKAFGPKTFQIGDRVEWLESDDTIPDGSSGTVLGWTKGNFVKVRFDSLPNGVLAIKSNELVYASRKARSLFGFKQDEEVKWQYDDDELPKG